MLQVYHTALLISALFTASVSCYAQNEPVVNLQVGNVYVYECDQRQVLAAAEYLIDKRVRRWTQILRIDSLVEFNNRQVFRLKSADQTGAPSDDQFWNSDEHSFYFVEDWCKDKVRMFWLDSVNTFDWENNVMSSWCFSTESFVDGIEAGPGLEFASRSYKCFLGQCAVQEWSYFY